MVSEAISSWAEPVTTASGSKEWSMEEESFCIRTAAGTTALGSTTRRTASESTSTTTEMFTKANGKTIWSMAWVITKTTKLESLWGEEKCFLRLPNFQINQFPEQPGSTANLKGRSRSTTEASSTTVTGTSNSQSARALSRSACSICCPVMLNWCRPKSLGERKMRLRRSFQMSARIPKNLFRKPLESIACHVSSPTASNSTITPNCRWSRFRFQRPTQLHPFALQAHAPPANTKLNRCERRRSCDQLGTGKASMRTKALAGWKDRTHLSRVAASRWVMEIDCKWNYWE